MVSLISNSSLLKTHAIVVLTAELGIFTGQLQLDLAILLLFREIKVNNL